jgi:1-aminocyclopropane-1-carboxylate deaminase/D-cysteine desulfhydrase-like pyridoxal-dependent ACC family enzyme
LIEARLAVAREHGLQHIFATVSPANVTCLQALDRAGFCQLDVATVYSERVLRALLHIDLCADLPARTRVQLCELPTPLRPLPRLSAHLGVELWVKRDDLTGLAMGGNKSRMLEYYVADARARGCRTLVTRGHLLSNHCRQTAAAAAQVGMDCALVLKGDPPPSLTGNVLLSTLLGAQIHWTGGQHDETFECVYAEISARGGAPYKIAYAGADTLGIQAFVAATREFVNQGQTFDRIVLASSSGATQAGLIVGTIVHRLATTISGVSVDEPRAVLESRIAEFTRRVCPDTSVDVESRIDVDDRYLGAGYGVPGPPEREAIELFARFEGLLLDPVYTGRAAAALIDRVRRGEIRSSERVLFWHTGGLPSLFALPPAWSTDASEACPRS